MIPTQSKATSEDKSEKFSNPGVFLSVSSKCNEIASSKDCINGKNFENSEDAWYQIHENIGVVQDITGDGNCGYHSFIGLCNQTRRTFGVNIPQMRSTKQFLLNVQKDLKKWCHENHHLFIEDNGKQDNLSIGYGKDFNNMFYNPLFEYLSIL